MAKKTRDSNLSIEERLEQALIPNWDEPYKLPPNWCWVKLSSVSIFERGITFPASAKESLRTTTNIPCLRTANVQESLKLDDLLYVDRSYVKDNSNKLVREKDIIMSTANSRELVGKTSFVHSLTEEMTFGGFIMAIRSKIDPKYLFYFLRLQFLNGKFMGNSTQTTNIANINSATLGETETPIPPLEEQKRIVIHIESLFAKLDEAKEKAQEVVDGFETRKAAILHKAFSGEFCTIDNSSNLDELLSDIFSYRENLIKSKVIQRAKLKAMEDKDIISSFPSSWKQLKLGEISFVTKLAGFEYTKYTKLEESGDIPVVRAQNVRKGYLDTTNLLYIDRQTSENLSRSALDKPSILITFIGAGIGDVCVFDKPQRFHLAPNVAKVEPYCDENGAINIKFLLYYLLSPSGQKEIFKSMKAVAQPSLSMETIRDIVIPFASREEQDEIVRVVENLIIKEQNAKETAEAVIEQIDTMKKAILARAFRGELGTNDPDEESAVELLKQVLTEDAVVQVPAKEPTKRISIPYDIKKLLSNICEEEIIRLLLKSAPQHVSIQEIMSLSSKKFELMDALRSLEKKQIITKNESGEYTLTR